MHWTVCSCHVTYVFQSECTLYSCLNIIEILSQSMRKIWSVSYCNWNRTQNHLVRKQTLNHLAKLSKWLSCILGTYLCGAFDCMFLSCHLHVSESIHTLCVDIKEIHAQSMHEIWNLSYCNWIRTQNHLVRNPTLNHLAKTAKWFSYVLSTFLYDTFDCIFLSCHLRVSEWIHTR